MKTPTAVRLVATCLGLFILLPDAGARIIAASSSSQSAALARLVWGILSCESHPCRDDSARHIRSLLEDRIVNEGSFQYSDLALAFPDVGRHLKGMVQWDLGSSVDGISLIIFGFDDSREALKSELEAGLPGCVIDTESADDDDAPASADAPADRSTAVANTKQENWDCTVDQPGHEPLPITLYVARETLMIELF